MRELKFRAYIEENRRKSFEYIDLNATNADELMRFHAVTNKSGAIKEQYTGLKDKNGVKIYEGDIVRIMGYGTYEVFWRNWDSSFSLKAIDADIEEEHKVLMLCEDWEDDYTIIGNIHESNIEELRRKNERNESKYRGICRDTANDKMPLLR